ncbi:hypothetical protein C2E25_15810, partial [Geothermobacter hydrogeniphilus]
MEFINKIAGIPQKGDMMKKQNQMTLGFLLMITLLGTSAFAAVPLTISYQGVLTDGAGAPVT